ncbi:hypothetical protein [Sorangium sp. So ce124]|uniref:hypothetical protein n=1 Tax=Sorangium sp. So ce124 TaxID=3133280 RepID=UPI003F5DD521
MWLKIAAKAAGERRRRAVVLPGEGHRAARIEDPFDHPWILSTVIEDISVEEMQPRDRRPLRARWPTSFSWSGRPSLPERLPL